MRWRRELPVYSPIGADAIAAGVRAWLGRDASAPARLEAMVQSSYGGEHVILTDSGTAALTLACRAATSRQAASRRIALPAYACPDLLTAVDAAGLDAVLYDIEPHTLGPDLDDLRRVLAERDVAAVVVAHLYGLPVDIAAVRNCTMAAGVLLIEDAAQGAGGTLDGAPLGAHGDFGILSFGRGKGRTGGGGGALLVRDSSMVPSEGLPAARSKPLAPILASLAQWLFATPDVYGVVARAAGERLGTTIYHSPHEPEPMPVVNAAMAETTWLPAEDEARERRVRVRALCAELQGSRTWRVPLSAAGGRAEPGWLRLPILATRGAPRARPDLGIVAAYPRTLAQWTESPASRGAARSCPGAEELARGLVTVPVHSRVSRRGTAAIRAFLREGGGANAV